MIKLLDNTLSRKREIPSLKITLKSILFNGIFTKNFKENWFSIGAEMNIATQFTHKTELEFTKT